MKYQIVSDVHAALDVAYADSLDEANRIASDMQSQHGNAEIRTAENFVPDIEEPTTSFSEDGLLEWSDVDGHLVVDHHDRKFGYPHPQL